MSTCVFRLVNSVRWFYDTYKVLKFEMSFQGHFKLPENDNFSLKIDETL